MSFGSPTIDYTDQIRRFSEIGSGGPNVHPPLPWVCYVQGIDPATNPVVQWQTPDGSVVPSGTGIALATGSQLFQIAFNYGVVLYRGPDYNSPDGEYCCVITTVPGQRRCVTLSEWNSNKQSIN